MGKSKRKDNEVKVFNKKLIIIISIFNLLISLSIISFTLYNFNVYNKKVDEKDKLMKEYNDIEKDYQDKNKENILIQTSIDELKDIDNRTETLKQEVFNLAKELEQDIKNNKSNKKIAYLTFDDGPYYLTYKYLDVLKKHGVKATFFTIGSNGEKCYDNKSKNCREVFKALMEDNHTIANHTYHHLTYNRYVYKSANNYITSLKKQEDLIKDKTGGYITNITRFPGGSNTAGKLKNSIIKKLRENNYGWVDWTAQDGDGGALSNKTTAMNNLKKSINEDIEVILFHDYSYITLGILPDAIKYLENKGYILLPLFYDSIMVNK